MIRRLGRSRVDERGSVTVWVVVAIGGLLSLFTGLVYDAGNAANQRVEISDAAWALARTAAAEVAPAGGGDFAIDESAARAAVTEVAAVQWPEFEWTLVVTDDQATVRVTGTYKTKILKAVGVNEWNFTADRTATTATG